MLYEKIRDRLQPRDSLGERGAEKSFCTYNVYVLVMALMRYFFVRRIDEDYYCDLFTSVARVASYNMRATP